MLLHRCLRTLSRSGAGRFAADLEWLQANGVAAERFNLAQQPGTFVETGVVRTASRRRATIASP